MEPAGGAGFCAIAEEGRESVASKRHRLSMGRCYLAGVGGATPCGSSLTTADIQGPGLAFVAALGVSAGMLGGCG